MSDRSSLEAAILALTRRFDLLESKTIAPLVGAVELLHKKVTEDEDAEEKMAGHRQWKCEACRALLGFYDEGADILRVRVKDYHLRTHPGAGGWVEVPCRRCGHINRATDPSPSGG